MHCLDILLRIEILQYSLPKIILINNKKYVKIVNE